MTNGTTVHAKPAIDDDDDDDSELEFVDAFENDQLQSVATQSEVAKLKAAAQATVIHTPPSAKPA